MLKSYNRHDMMTDPSREGAATLYHSDGKTGLEWNQYIGQVILRDFIGQLTQFEGLDFDQYIKDVVPYIQLGLFDSAIKKIKAIDIPGLESVKEWLIKSLGEAEDRQLP